LCVQDYVEGRSLDAWLANGRAGSGEGQRIAQAGARIVLEMVFVHGLYHADPHGGNVLLMPDGRLALLDFGMIGRLSAARRAEFFDFLSAVAARREERAVDILLDWAGPNEVDETLLAADVAAFLDRYHGSTLREIDLAALLGDVAALLRDNELSLPVDVAMLLKLFITLEDLGRSLDPGFKMAAEVEAFVASEMEQAKSPLGMLRRGFHEFERVATSLPHDLRPLLARLRRGRFRLELELSRLDRFSRDIERSVNRLTIGLVTSALIVGTSVALTVPGGARVWGFPAVALLGFVSSLVLGLGLLVAIVRSGHK
jgi:ubiquinone biosynthesis protein